jgi:hypothetical protein
MKAIRIFFKMMILCCAVSFSLSALEAPYLISATALSDSSISLAWRNNDAAATGTIVMRRLLSESSYKTVDSIKSTTQVTYTDVKGLMPETAYSYQLRAFSQSAISDSSNSANATTLALTPVFIAPSATIAWDYDTSRYPTISVIDSSNCESGYRIYRDQDFSGTFSEITYHPSSIPKNKGAFQIIDTGNSLNNWYTYKISAIKGDSSIAVYCTTFTFRSIKAQQAVRFSKIGTFPLSVDSGWSAKVGDSIIVKENPAPEGKFTVLNIKDPKNPKFDGYADSAALLSYQAETLIPFFLKNEVKNNNFGISRLVKIKDEVTICSDKLLRRFRINGSGIELLDSLFTDSITSLPVLDLNRYSKHFQWMRLINDSLFVAICAITEFAVVRSFSSYYFLIFREGSTDKQPLFSIYMGEANDRGKNTFSTILGAFDNQILMFSQTTDFYSSPSKEEIIVSRISGGCVMRSSRREPFSNAYFTGFSLSKDDNLYTNSFSTSWNAPSANSFLQLYSANNWDARGYETAVANNAVYSDSIHKQNMLKNIFADTAKKVVYLVFNDALTVLGYEFGPAIGVKHQAKQSGQHSRIFAIIPQRIGRGVTFLLPSSSLNSRIEIFDIGGRVIDRLALSRSNAVLWQPKIALNGCFIIVATIEGKRYCERFFLK